MPNQDGTGPFDKRNPGRGLGPCKKKRVEVDKDKGKLVEELKKKTDAIASVIRPAKIASFDKEAWLEEIDAAYNELCASPVETFSQNYLETYQDWLWKHADEITRVLAKEVKPSWTKRVAQIMEEDYDPAADLSGLLVELREVRGKLHTVRNDFSVREFDDFDEAMETAAGALEHAEKILMDHGALSEGLWASKRIAVEE